MARLQLLPVLLLAACAVTFEPRGPHRTDDLFARIQPGMTRDDVAALAGRPDNTMAFPASRTDSWGWFYFDTWGYYSEFSVTFDANGRAVSKISRRVMQDGVR